jgi:predicted hotdog family 3-hydroxylacyl-ACP dehydratase
MSLDRGQISELIPHAGSMVLLDRVVDWNSVSISCLTESHLRPDNPLRRDGMLPAVAGIELAGQAMAIHTRLTSDGPKRTGVLGSLRDVQVNCDRLDTCDVPLIVSARLLSGGGGGRMYSFGIHAGDSALIDGRASVFFL